MDHACSRSLLTSKIGSTTLTPSTYRQTSWPHQFALNQEQALAIVRKVVEAILQWRAVGMSAHVGMTRHELDEFAPAFEHASLDEAKHLVGL